MNRSKPSPVSLGGSHERKRFDPIGFLMLSNFFFPILPDFLDHTLLRNFTSCFVAFDSADLCSSSLLCCDFTAVDVLRKSDPNLSRMTNMLTPSRCSHYIDSPLGQVCNRDTPTQLLPALGLKRTLVFPQELACCLSPLWHFGVAIKGKFIDGVLRVNILSSTATRYRICT